MVQILVSDPLKHILGLGTLECQKTPALESLPFDFLSLVSRIPLFELLRDMGLVLGGSPGVSDDVKSGIGVLGDNGIVNDTSLLVQKHGQGGGEWFE